MIKTVLVGALAGCSYAGPTWDADRLYVHLNAGTLGPSASGEFGLSSSKSFVVAPLKSQMGTQYYDLTPEWPALPKIGSVTIYRYDSDVQEAYGRQILLSVDGAGSHGPAAAPDA